MAIVRGLVVATVLAAAVLRMSVRGEPVAPSDAGAIARGRYLVVITGCNDCHTPAYLRTGGQVPEEEWLVGDRLGWRGPWGTTYPSNLRLFTQNLTEDQWVTLARRARLRPPMPWYALRHMTDEDLRAMYQFIRHLGPAGSAVPEYVPPDKEPAGPYVLFPAAR